MNIRSHRALRWILSLLVLAAGLSAAWAWGRAAQMAEAAPEPKAPLALYAAWRPSGDDSTRLFRSTDEGLTWQSLVLPAGAVPVAWAGDGGRGLAVALDNGEVLRSENQGDAWTVVVQNLPVLSMAWEGSTLYLGTDRQGIYRQEVGSGPVALGLPQSELAAQAVRSLAVSQGRLYVAVRFALLSTADRGETWTTAAPIPEQITAVAAVTPDLVYVGTATGGIYKSSNGGQSWQSASEGLGQAAGLYVQITALQPDPQEKGVLYAAVGYLVGGTELHFSAMGTFVTLDEGASWLRLSGPTFPEAQRASALVVAPGKPLYAHAVTAAGLQEYAPDAGWAMAALTAGDPLVRMNAARMLGLGRVAGAGDALVAALSDPDARVALLAAEALGRIADPITTPSLLGALDSSNGQVKLNAAHALGMMKAEVAVPALRAMLLDGDARFAGGAAEALRQIGTRSAVDALLVALADPEMTVRRNAALLSVQVMGEPAVPALSLMLASSDEAARHNAAEALGLIRSPAATAVLERALQDPSAVVRTGAAWALGEIGAPGARTALDRAQQRDPSPEVRAAASAALAEIKQQPVSISRLPAEWASALGRFQALRWLVAVLALAGAAWLILGSRRLNPLPVLHRIRRH